MTDSSIANENPTSPTTSSATIKEKPSVKGAIEQNEIRVTAQGKMRNYVAYATTIFAENKSQTVVLKGMGRVINKTVSLAEILKRRIKGLYQMAEIGSIQINDQKSGKDEDEKDIVRLLSVIKITLTADPVDKEKYQAPIDEFNVETIELATPRRIKPKGGRKNGKKAKTPVAEKPTESTELPRAPIEEVPVPITDDGANGQESAPKPRTFKSRRIRKMKKKTEKTSEVIAPDAVIADDKTAEPAAVTATSTNPTDTTATPVASA